MLNSEKKKVIDYLNGGTVVASAAGYPKDHETGEYVNVEYLGYTDGNDMWTTEDIINFKRHGEVFNQSLIDRILKV